MKSLKYSIIGLFAVSIVFVAGNSFAQMFNVFAESLGNDQVQLFRRTAYDRGPGTFADGYSDPSTSGVDILAASTIISSEINTMEGNYLAEISDLVIDPSNGRVSNVVLNHVPMMGAKDVDIPFSALLRAGQTIFVHRTPEGVYHQFTGEAPYWSEGLYICSKEKEPAGGYRASKLIGSSVRTSKGEELGRIDDLGVDSKEGRVVYLVVSHEGMEGKIVPFSPLRSAGNAFTLNIAKEQFEAASAYSVQTAQAAWKPSYGLSPIAEYNWVVKWPAGR